ncbi:MAG: 3-deoxy-8-phosphooctulonate synthase [Verrucomicrobia bacterium]|nr:3-deoxy-8-phosphooctulonate synthase [Verrucomicrobiota bacterium]MDA1087601.1 3-deoxy-8-phosphooctulonate synthase [Verrucomicrobiota bacterium]
MKHRSVSIGRVCVGHGSPLVMISGPCVIESRRHCLGMAKKLKALAAQCRVKLIFKASYDKANRTSLKSYRGPGLTKGLEILREVREEFGLPVLTDVHSIEEAETAAEVVDCLQLPAFLCRQTDLVLALGRTGRPVNIKKAQFLAPADMAHVIAKIESTGNRKILLTERGTSFGYHDLVADMRSLVRMRELGYPVIFDATHSVQSPGGAGGVSGGEGALAPDLARAAAATGCDAVFCETHERPERALSDGANAVRLSELRKLWPILKKIDTICR